MNPKPTSSPKIEKPHILTDREWQELSYAAHTGWFRYVYDLAAIERMFAVTGNVQIAANGKVTAEFNLGIDADTALVAVRRAINEARQCLSLFHSDLLLRVSRGRVLLGCRNFNGLRLHLRRVTSNDMA